MEKKKEVNKDIADGKEHGNKIVVTRMFSKPMFLDTEEALDIKKIINKSFLG